MKKRQAKPETQIAATRWGVNEKYTNLTRADEEAIREVLKFFEYELDENGKYTGDNFFALDPFGIEDTVDILQYVLYGRFPKWKSVRQHQAARAVIETGRFRVYRDPYKGYPVTNSFEVPEYWQVMDKFPEINRDIRKSSDVQLIFWDEFGREITAEAKVNTDKMTVRWLS